MLKALTQIWYVFDFMCGKRLVVVLRTMLAVLGSFGEVPLTAEVRAKHLSTYPQPYESLPPRAPPSCPAAPPVRFSHEAWPRYGSILG